MDLQDAPAFKALGVELVSISPDHPDSWNQVASDYAIVPSSLLSDPRNRIAGRYGVMRWRVPAGADVDSAEPGHTFVLVGDDGTVLWIRDYGAPQNGGRMYVPPGELIPELRRAIEAQGRS